MKPKSGPPEAGTLVIAALLLLAIVFTGCWIIWYVTPGADPNVLFPWFGTAAAAIIVIGGVVFFIRSRWGAP